MVDRMQRSLDGISVLVVEDDTDTLELFAASLSKRGAIVRTATSAEQALELLAVWRPDALLCDLHLPGVDGYTLLERIRRIPAMHDLPVIAISASHPALERDRSLEAGFASHLSKPTRLSEIIDAVTGVVVR